MILLYFFFLKRVSSQNSNNQTNISNSKDSDQESNEITLGIFSFLFAVFAIIILIGIFFFVEKFICKKKGKFRDFFRALFRSTHIFKRMRRIKPKPKKKRLCSRGSVVNNKETQCNFL